MIEFLEKKLQYVKRNQIQNVTLTRRETENIISHIHLLEAKIVQLEEKLSADSESE